MAKKYSFEDVKEYVESKGCELLSSEYIGIYIPLKIRFSCGHIGKKSLANMKKSLNTLCLKCSNGIGKVFLYDDVKKYVESKGCKLISQEYNNSMSLLDIIDAQGHLYKMAFKNFKNRNRIMCLKCVKQRASKYFLKPMDEVISILENSGYKYIEGKYRDNGCKISIKDRDGYKYYTSISAVRVAKIKNAIGKEARIYKFDSSNIYTIDNIKLWLKIERKNFYLSGGSYLNAHAKTLEFCCLDCSNIWLSNWNNVKNGKECPQCKSSKGERKIRLFLDLHKNKISFIPQFSFDDCVHYRKLRFDFGIFNEEKTYMCEYNGKLHYEPVKFYGGNDYFLKIQKKDKIKIDYCNKNNIPLITIPYWEYKNIESILYKELEL